MELLDKIYQLAHKLENLGIEEGYAIHDEVKALHKGYVDATAENDALKSELAALKVKSVRIELKENIASSDKMKDLIRREDVRQAIIDKGSVLMNGDACIYATLALEAIDAVPASDNEHVGWQLVPIEPTWEMQNHASEVTDVNSFLDLQAVYKAMLKAAIKTRFETRIRSAINEL